MDRPIPTEEEKALAYDSLVAAVKAMRNRTNCGLGDALDAIKAACPNVVEISHRKRAEMDAEYRQQREELEKLRNLALENNLMRAYEWLQKHGVA